VDLLQEEKAAAPVEGAGDAGEALLAGLGPVARPALLEAVDEAGDRGERGNGRRAEGHREMLAAGPGLH
jgi:hypothetical protein